MVFQKPSTLPIGKNRLERVIAHLGLASRREAKALIEKGEVKVNGKVIREPGFGICDGKDKIEIKSVSHENRESFLVYKPRGIETNKTTPNARDLHTVFPELKHLHPIGRLDKESEGAIIMSNDGTLAKALTASDCHVGKEYNVFVREKVSDSALKKMADGIILDGVITKPARTKRISDTAFGIVLFEGRKHQIRRMCDALHLTIEKLVRVKIGHLSVGPIKSGEKKKISTDDVKKLKG